MVVEPPVPGCTVIVKVTGTPTCGVPAVEIDTVGSGSTFTVTLAVGAAVGVVPVVPATPDVTVTLAVLVDVRTAVATPLALVVATDGLTAPLSVEKVTGTPATMVPPVSLTVAEIVDDPPGEIVDGEAVTLTVATPAAPTAILIAPVAPVVTPPETAVIVAVPDWPLALKATITRPPASVSASTGSIVPSDVVKLTSVPRWGGVPDGSITCAMMFVVPDSGRVVASVDRVIVDPEGASSATRWQATMASGRSAHSARAAPLVGRWKTVIMDTLTILNRMNLRGQSENGYAMAALLVIMAVMAVMMSVAMPVWNHASQREKEAELVFRGQQYSRAIGLFERKYANTPPPNIDVLVQERFLRKKYKDPITNADFVPVSVLGATPAGVARGGGPGPGVATTPGAPVGGAGGTGGGIVGVTSASKATSIRVYNGATHYNEWRFVYAPPAATPGAGGGPGSTTPGPRGQGPGRRGGPPATPGGGFGNGRGFGGPGQGGPTRGGPGTNPQPPQTPGRGR
jgi:type II secretory pathway pseudopilin PulG